MANGGVPIAELVSAPLIAAAKAQRALSESTVSYIEAFTGGERAKTISFALSSGDEELCVDIPTIALAPIPSIAVDEITVDFQMEVTTTERDEKTGEFAVEGSVSTSEQNTRSTNQSAKYQIHVAARKQEHTEALSRVLDLLAENISTKKKASKNENDSEEALSISEEGSDES